MDMYDQQYGRLHGSDGMPPLFAVYDAVFAKNHMRIVKDFGSGLKRDVMLLSIGRVLSGVPFEPHGHTYCITYRRCTAG
jgi:hypothetical protein